MSSNEEPYDSDDLIDDEFSESSDDEIRICNKCPARLPTVTARLKAPNLLAQQGIPCLIFGEDALALVFWVYASVFPLHIVVADANRDCAVDIITSSSSLSYKRSGPDPGPASIDPALPMDVRSKFAESVYLQTEDDYDNPVLIVVHPETTFGLDVADFMRSTPVDMFPGSLFHENIRLPKPHAMVDAIIDSFLEHGKGLVTAEGNGELVIWLIFIVTRGYRVGSTVSGEGQDAQALLGNIKEENREYFEAWMRWDASTGDVDTHQKRRKAVMDRKAYVLFVVA